MSLLADYYKERFGWRTIETEDGFIVYDLQPPEASIEEFFVRPEKRGGRTAKDLADLVFRLVREGGAKRVWARVTIGTGGAEHALRTNLHYGFKMIRNEGDSIIMSKEIKGE